MSERFNYLYQPIPISDMNAEQVEAWLQAYRSGALPHDAEDLSQLRARRNELLTAAYPANPESRP